MTLDNGITQSAKRKPGPDSAGAAPEGKTDDRRTKGSPYPARPAQRATAAGKAKRANGSREKPPDGIPRQAAPPPKVPPEPRDCRRPAEPPEDLPSQGRTPCKGWPWNSAETHGWVAPIKAGQDRQRILPRVAATQK